MNMVSMVPVIDVRDIPVYRETPVERLLRHQNLGEPLPSGAGHADVVISMCMDYRKDLRRRQSEGEGI